MTDYDDVDDEEELVPLGQVLKRVQKKREKLGDTHHDKRLTDSANAERWCELHGERFRWHAGRQCWMVWDGVRWSVDDGAEALRTTKDVGVSWLHREAPTADPQFMAACIVHAKRSESAGARRAMLQLAAAEEGMSVATSAWDADPWLLNCSNGVLDLRDGKLLKHHAPRMMSKLAPTSYDADAAAPRFARFLEQALPDVGVRDFVQRLIGYSLTGVVREHVLPVFYGSGGNGKGTLVNTLGAILGDYARAVPADLLMRKTGGDQHPTERATLLGLRLAFASETEAGRQLAESTVKGLTGGDPISARFMRQDFFEFLPSHKLILSTNHRPQIKGSDAGIWRRVRLVPWETAPSSPDTTLGEALTREGPGILRWAVEGCLAWQRDGLGSAGKIDAATAAYRHEQDVLAAFLTDCTTSTPDAQTPSPELFAAYRAWCEDGGEYAWRQRTFVQALEERGLQRLKTGGRMVWRGLGLLADRPGAKREEKRWGRERTEVD